MLFWLAAFWQQQTQPLQHLCCQHSCGSLPTPTPTYKQLSWLLWFCEMRRRYWHKQHSERNSWWRWWWWWWLFSRRLIDGWFLLWWFRIRWNESIWSDTFAQTVLFGWIPLRLFRTRCFSRYSFRYNAVLQFLPERERVAIIVVAC